jgi:quercetin dioxygenase-like cupin family protein
MKLRFDAAEERRVLADGRVVVDVLRIGEVPVLRVTHAAGWRWSTHSAHAAGTATCGNVHVGVMISGRMMVQPLEASSYELIAGDAFAIPASHDAWTVGDEPAVLVQVDEGARANLRYSAVELARSS